MSFEDISAGTVSIVPLKTSPVKPSMLIASPVFSVVPSKETSPRAASTWIAERPTTAGFPRPRVTTAAWLVIPPRLVSTAPALRMAGMSSALVSGRTRMARSPSRSASSPSMATMPVAAPGEAFSPVPSSRPSCTARTFDCSSKRGRRSCESSSAGTRSSASSRLMRPSSTMSTAVLTAAIAVRFPERVWRMNRRPFSIVNSMSWTSRKWFSRFFACSTRAL